MKVLYYLCSNVNCEPEKWLLFNQLNFSKDDKKILCCPNCGHKYFLIKLCERGKQDV